MSVVIPEPVPDEPEVVDTGDTIVIADGGGGEAVAHEVGEHEARIAAQDERIAQLEAELASRPTYSEVVEVAADVAESVAVEAAAEVAEVVAEPVAEETAEEVAEEIAAESGDNEPGGTHWLFRPGKEWRHGK